MSFLRSKKSSSAGIAPAYTGLQLQTSTSMLPIPIIYGQQLVAANLIWYGNFMAMPQRQKTGKGGSKGSVTSYNYSASIILALGEGPLRSINYVRKDTNTVSMGWLGMNFFNGTLGQGPWGSLPNNDASMDVTLGLITVAGQNQALSYPSTAYVCAYNYALGSNAEIGNHNFEVVGISAGTAWNGVDADPAPIINDFLTNAQYGVGFSAASISGTSLFGQSGDSSLQTYCQAAGIALSPVLNETESASSILSRWLQLCNCAAVWSGGLLKFIPYGDAAIGGNNAMFYPNVTPVYALGDRDYVSDGQNDPLQIFRSDPFTIANIQRLEVLNRWNYYAPTPVEARDQAMIDCYGPRIGQQITAHEICDPNIGGRVAQIILQRALYIRSIAKFKLSAVYCLLDPMDIVTLTDTNLGLVISPFRIIEIVEDENGILSVTAEEFIAGVNSPAQNPTQGSIGGPINTAITAAPVHTPLIYEPPPAATGNVAQVWLGASGGNGNGSDTNWGGANVYVSLDNIAYTQIATLTQVLRQGLLTANLPQQKGFDTSSILSVDLTESAGSLLGTTDSAAQQGITLCLVDNELLAYANAALTAASTYNLTHLQRGLLGTTASAHTSGAAFARLDDALVKYNLPSGYVGKTLYLKFQSFNIFGSGFQDLSTCSVYTYNPSGVGAIGPVVTALSLGQSQDWRFASETVAVGDDFGTILAPVYTTINLGNTQP